tara:strand:- start:2547 stop:2789 length:243 start_codon:yes stop_codon:yes gene_type:complete
MSIINISIQSEIQNKTNLEIMKTTDINTININYLEFKNDYNNEYQLKINKFDPQKKIIKNNWEKRLLSRINSYIITNINN